MRREATIYAGRPISAPAVAKPQHDGSWRAPTNAPVCRSDSYHIRRRGAKSFVDDLVLSRGVVLSRADLFCDLLRLSPLTRRFVSFRLTYLRLGTVSRYLLGRRRRCIGDDGCSNRSQHRRRCVDVDFFSIFFRMPDARFEPSPPPTAWLRRLTNAPVDNEDACPRSTRFVFWQQSRNTCRTPGFGFEAFGYLK